MKIQKIVSFLPSATELIYELNAQELLKGVTHECIYPNDAKTLPRIITSVFDSEKLSSEEIDIINTNLIKEGKDIFKLDEEKLRNAEPDLIVCQNTCEVCAAHNNQINRAIHILDKKPILHSMDPHNLDEILQSTKEFGQLIEKREKVEALCANLQERIKKIKTKNFDKKPRVLAIEWIKPFFSAGHWIPEMIDIAGGHNLISKSGDHSKRITIQEISKAEPEIIILMPCGFNTNRSLKEYQQFLQNNSEWQQLIAVKQNNVFVVDANSYFSKPSIRTITGLEILSRIIHPETTDTKVPENSFAKVN